MPPSLPGPSCPNVRRRGHKNIVADLSFSPSAAGLLCFLLLERRARVVRCFILSKNLFATFCPVGTCGGAAAVSGRIIYRSPLLIPIILSPERQLPLALGLPSIHPSIRSAPSRSRPASQKIHCEAVAVGSDDVFIFRGIVADSNEILLVTATSLYLLLPRPRRIVEREESCVLGHWL